MIKPQQQIVGRHRWQFLAVLLICCWGLPTEIHAGKPVESFTLKITANPKDPRRCLVVVTANQPEFWGSLKQADEEKLHEVLTFKLQKQSGQNIPAMLGHYRIKENRLEFEPAFPLVRGTRYQATFDPKPLELSTKTKAKLLQAEFYIPLPNLKPPRVLAIYPSGKRLPANHLKFYIQFSEPMQQGEIFEYFSLFNKTQNKQVPRPFRHTELWSPDGKQLTLWFHPGRQKAGVNLKVELGAILNEGDEYELKIDPKWASLSGHALGTPVSKTFSAVAIDERQPFVKDWKLSVPLKGTRKPLICELGEPLDYVLLKDQMKVQTEQGAVLKGQIQLGQHESVWRFIPDSPWQAGHYRLVAGTVLEDLAGNSIERPFAIDVSKRKSNTPNASESRSLEFAITD